MTGLGDELYAGESRLARAHAMGGVPAFVRRARRLEVAVHELHREIAAEWERRTRKLLPLVPGVEVAVDLRPIIEILRRHPAYRARPRGGPRVSTGLADRFRREAKAFNREWLEFLGTVSLARIHALQRDYNRYYPIERESALRGVPLRPFRPIPLLDRAELLERHPPLPV